MSYCLAMCFGCVFNVVVFRVRGRELCVCMRTVSHLINLGYSHGDFCEVGWGQKTITAVQYHISNRGV